MQITAAQKIVQKLLENNVKVVFEYPGGNIAPILDCIKRESNIDLIVTRNDQAASLMADAYSRVSGETSVCMATLGPGASNLITGIANAYFDSIPVVVITGQVGLDSYKGYKDTRQLGFQEMDIVSMATPVTKWSYLIKKPEDVSWVIDRAFQLANEGRPGPVLIDVPMNIQRANLNEEDLLEGIINNIGTRRIEQSKIEILVKQINQAEKPVIISGGGVVLSKAEQELAALAQEYGIPVANTLMGQGSFDQYNELSLGFMGCYGSRFCNKAVAEADLVIGVGTRFDLRAIGTEVKKFSENRFVAQIDIDHSEIKNRVKVNLGIQGDAKEVLTQLLAALRNAGIKNNTRNWVRRINSLREELSLDSEYGLNLDGKYDKVRPQYIIKKISDTLKGEAIVSADVGQNQMWLAQFMKYRYPRTNLTSGGLGTMGYGLPAAIAAKYARPDLNVVNITGDGSFQMNIQELATAKEYGLPIKVFIMHNNTLGLVKQFQDKTFIGKATSTEFGYNPNFLKIAEAYNAVGFIISMPDQIDSVVEQAMSITDRSIIVDCVIDKDEVAIPEIEGGHYLNDQFPYTKENY
ncbi:biosynthetic-type acetolactate synthase large subunit [Paradesulfitobacterium aromaticivorans]